MTEAEMEEILLYMSSHTVLLLLVIVHVISFTLSQWTFYVHCADLVKYLQLLHDVLCNLGPGVLFLILVGDFNMQPTLVWLLLSKFSRNPLTL